MTKDMMMMVMMTTMMMNYVHFNILAAKITMFDALILKIIFYHRFVLNRFVLQL